MCFCLPGVLLFLLTNAFGQNQGAIKIMGRADTVKNHSRTDVVSKLKLLKEFEHKTAAIENYRLRASVANVRLQRNSLLVGIIIAIGIAIWVGVKNSQRKMELIAPAVGAVAHEIQLSEREKEILHFLVKGLSYKQIAAECNITYSTVRFHMGNIYTKLQVSSMTEAVAKALLLKLV
jgi:DNA-binding CsgD family transcriptional regulator